MERIARLSPGLLNEHQQRLYAAITSGPRGGTQPVPLIDDAGALTGPFNAMLLQPAIGGALQALGAAVRYQGSLPSRTRELVILVVATHWSSEFEQHMHEAAGRHPGCGWPGSASSTCGAGPAGLSVNSVNEG